MDLVSFIMREKKIDTVIHFAAQTHVGTLLVVFLYPFGAKMRGHAGDQHACMYS